MLNIGKFYLGGMTGIDAAGVSRKNFKRKGPPGGPLFWVCCYFPCRSAFAANASRLYSARPGAIPS